MLFVLASTAGRPIALDSELPGDKGTDRYTAEDYYGTVYFMWVFAFQIEHHDLGGYILQIFDGDSRDDDVFAYRGLSEEAQYIITTGPSALIVMELDINGDGDIAEVGRGFSVEYRAGQLDTEINRTSYMYPLINLKLWYNHLVQVMRCQ